MSSDLLLSAHGSGAALVTLFDADGKLLVDETADFAKSIAEAGASCILVCGTAGEFWTLDDEERVTLVRAVRSAVPEVPVLAQVGGVPTERAVRLTKGMIDLGVDAVVALPEGIVELKEFYDAIIAAALSTPVVAYHLPNRATPIPLEDVMGLGVSAIKDSSGDARRLAQEIMSLGIQTFTGNPILAGVASQLGGAGSLTGVANIRPDWCARAWAGDQSVLSDIARLNIETSVNFPTELKKAVAARWKVSTHSRRGR